MDALEPKKLALLRILQILKTQSDVNHPLTQGEIATLKLQSIPGDKKELITKTWFQPDIICMRQDRENWFCGRCTNCGSDH